MKLFDCPEWVADKDAALLGIARAASSFFRFMNKQNPKGYLFSHGDIKHWHKKFFEETVPVPYYAGYYRGEDPARPCLDAEVHVSGAFGAPAAEVEPRMKAFSEQLVQATIATDEYVEAHSTIERIRAAAQIAAFAGGSIIQIHPFINGNGRMARMVMNFFLHRYLHTIPFFIDRPSHPDYSTASKVAMFEGNFSPLYQYLIEITALAQ